MQPLQMSLHPSTLFCYHWHYYALPATLTHPSTQTISCTSHITPPKLLTPYCSTHTHTFLQPTFNTTFDSHRSPLPPFYQASPTSSLVPQMFPPLCTWPPNWNRSSISLPIIQMMPTMLLETKPIYIAKWGLYTHPTNKDWTKAPILPYSYLSRFQFLYSFLAFHSRNY